MRGSKLLLATLIATGAAFAQAPLPGTFSSTPPQSTSQSNGSSSGAASLVVSPPKITYGDGITPTVITNTEAVSVVVPENANVSPASVPATNPATLENTPLPGTLPNTAGTTANGPARHFDYIISPGNAYGPPPGSMSDSSVSLGDIARQFRQQRAATTRTVTNADIAALNQQYGSTPDNSNGAVPMQDNGAAAVAAPQQQNPNPVAPMNSGGATGAAATTGQSTGTQQQSPFEPRGTQPKTEREQYQPPSQPVPNGENEHSATQQNGQQQQLPKSSSLLPLLGTIGAVCTLGGALVWKMR